MKVLVRLEGYNYNKIIYKATIIRAAAINIPGTLNNVPELAGEEAGKADVDLFATPDAPAAEDDDTEGL